MKKSYKSTWRGIISIVAAETPGQARARTVKSFLDANYEGSFTEVTVQREPKFDAWAAVDESQHAWDEQELLRRHGERPSWAI